MNLVPGDQIVFHLAGNNMISMQKETAMDTYIARNNLERQARALRRAEFDRLAGMGAVKWRTLVSRLRDAFASSRSHASIPRQIAPKTHP
jgi:hypothetical protein